MRRRTGCSGSLYSPPTRQAHSAVSFTKRHRRIALSHWFDSTCWYRSGTCADADAAISAPSMRRTVHLAPLKYVSCGTLPNSPLSLDEGLAYIAQAHLTNKKRVTNTSR